MELAKQCKQLESKIEHSVYSIQEFISMMKESGKDVYISVSGGNDSIVMMDIIRRFVDPNIKAVFCNTGNEYPEIVKFIKSLENVDIIRPEYSIKDIIYKFGFPLVSKEQSQYIREAKSTKSEKLLDIRMNGRKDGFKGKISDKHKHLVYQPFNVSEKCCYYLKKKPFKDYEKKNNSVPFLGIRINESQLRKSEFHKRCGSMNSYTGHIASYPVSLFTKQDIYDYIERFNVPYCEIYDYEEIDSTGCAACGFGLHRDNSRLVFIYEHYPKFYNQVMNYKNNGVTYKEALLTCGVDLPCQILF